MGLLAGRPTGRFSIGPGAASRLADLGVTHVSVVGDEEVMVVLIEGWSFDPGRSGAQAAESLLVGGGGIILREVARVSVAPGGFTR